MRKKLLSIVGSITFKQSVITFLGTSINGFLGVVFYVILARELGPVAFGLFTIAVTLLTLVADIAGFGTDTGLVNFIGKYIKSDKVRAFGFMTLALKVKLIVGLAIIVLGMIFSGPIAINIFNNKDLLPLFRIAFIGVGTSFLFTFSTQVYVGLQKFVSWSFLNIGANLIRLASVVILAGISLLNVQAGMIVYVLVPLLAFVISLVFFPKGWFKADHNIQIQKEFFNYNKWVAAFVVVAAVSSRLDTFISARLLPLYEVGLYGVAVQLASIVSQIVSAIGTVVAPKMASLGSLEDFKQYFKKVLVMVIGISAAGLLVVPAAWIMIPLIYGPSYLAVFPIFVFLFLGGLIFLISVPVHNGVIYYFSYPKLFFSLGLLNLVIVSVVGWFMVSKFGAIGAALTVMLNNSINLAVPSIWLAKRVHKI